MQKTDPDGRPGHRQFVGQYVRDETEAPLGTLVLRRTPEDGFSLLIIAPGVGLATVTKAKTATPSLRRTAEEVLADPAAELKRQVGDAMNAADGARARLDELGPPRTSLATEKGAKAFNELELRKTLTHAIERFEKMDVAIPL